ncbi:MAG: hypothetical protein FWB89_01125 [Treponema sp.]|nr:hypothetical protein [Treponema sp.]
MDYKKTFEKFEGQNTFIRVSSPVPVEGQEKAALNRKGNQKYNEGDVEGAKRIFLTTGYSDGLSRVGDFYKTKNRSLEALRMYWLAHDKKKAEPIIEQTAFLLQNFLNDNDDKADGIDGDIWE